MLGHNIGAEFDVDVPNNSIIFLKFPFEEVGKLIAGPARVELWSSDATVRTICQPVNCGKL